MKKCLIITGYVEGKLKEVFNTDEFDYIICADNGYYIANESQVTPNLIIGDFDSLKKTVSLPDDIETITFPSEKDYTDTMICIQEALRRGYFDISIAGGLGGRFDHTIANIQSMSWALNEGLSRYAKTVKIILADGKNIIHLIKDSSLVLEGHPGEKFSLLSHTSNCLGVTVKHAKWPLLNANLTSNFPIGVSNEFLSDSCTISVADGELLIMKSID